jgi:hypothetical protein
MSGPRRTCRTPEVEEKVGRVSAERDRAGPGRRVGVDPTGPRTRSCPGATSELLQSRRKGRQDTPCTRQGYFYSSRRRVRDALKVLRRRRGVSDARAEGVMSGQAVDGTRYGYRGFMVVVVV